ncbi:MAG: hypothetical protein ACO1NU_08695 [Arcticibacter sp.]
MPSTYPEMWEKRVERNLNDATDAPWLDNIPELDTEVIEVGSGTATEKNIIHIPASDFEPTVLVDNTAYPLAVEQYDDNETIVRLHKFQSLPTELTDDQVLGASYDKIDAATTAHKEAILAKKYVRAAHAMAPAANTPATPVILTDGVGLNAATAASGARLQMSYENLVAFKVACDKAKMPVRGRRLVLCDDHWNDLLLDRKNFGDQMVNYKEGSPAPRILGFDLFRYSENPHYNGTTKLAFGAVPTDTQSQASFAFVASNVAKKTGFTKQYFRDAKIDPENQSNKLNYRHYFVACPKRLKYIAAIASGRKA